MKAILFHEADHALAEGPVWHDGQWWWVDIEGRTLNRIQPSSGRHESKAIGPRPGAAVPCDDGRWLVAHENGFGFYDWDHGVLADFDLFLGGESRVRMNDAKCDPRGRLLAGTLQEDLQEGGATLYALEGEKRSVLLSGVTISNGLGWSADGARLYYVDTLTHRIDVFDYDLDAGGISNRRPLAEVPDGEGYPDGLAMDCNGNLWVALWGGSVVQCYDGETGKVLERITCPVAQPSSCCFGGPDGMELLITSAWQGYSAEQRRAEPLAGSLFIAEAGVRGAPVTLFKTKV